MEETQQGISGMAGKATGVTMRPESDICFRSRDLWFKLLFGPQISQGVSAVSCAGAKQFIAPLNFIY